MVLAQYPDRHHRRSAGAEVISEFYGRLLSTNAAHRLQRHLIDVVVTGRAGDLHRSEGDRGRRQTLQPGKVSVQLLPLRITEKLESIEGLPKARLRNRAEVEAR